RRARVRARADLDGRRRRRGGRRRSGRVRPPDRARAYGQVPRGGARGGDGETGQGDRLDRGAPGLAGVRRVVLVGVDLIEIPRIELSMTQSSELATAVCVVEEPQP